MIEHQYLASAFSYLKRALASHFVKKGRAIDSIAMSIIYGGMVKGITRTEIDDFIERLSTERADGWEEQRALDAAIAALTRCRRFAADGTEEVGSVSSRPRDQNEVARTPLPIGAMKSGPFFGMGMREACVRQLEIVGSPQSAAEIWSGLSAGGFTSAHNDPPAAVHNALMRRTKTHGDVLLVGKGKWDLKSKYSEAQLAQIAQSLGGMPGRDHATHRESVKRGMLVARDRGVKFGAPLVFDAEQARQFKELLEQGVKTTKICEKLKISRPTFYDYKRRLANWSPGDPYPPRMGEEPAPAGREPDAALSKKTGRVVN